MGSLFMVAEAIETPAVEAVSGDADAPNLADAAQPTEVTPEPSGEQEPLSLESARAAYFQDESKGSDKGVTESGIDEAKLAEWRANRAELGNQHQARQRAIDALAEELSDLGIPEHYAKRIVKAQKDLLNEHHADVLRLGQAEAVGTALMREQMQIRDAINATIPKDRSDSFMARIEAAAEKNDGVAPYSDVYKAVWEEALEHQKAANKKANESAFEAGFNAGRGIGEKGKESGNSGNVAQGRSTGGPSMTRAQFESLPWQEQDKVPANRRQAIYEKGAG